MVLEPRNDGPEQKPGCSKHVGLRRNLGCKRSHQYGTLPATGVFMQDGICGVGRRRSAVLKFVGQRDMLKGVLWWFVMAFLVGVTLAAQVGETRRVTHPPSTLNKDVRCWKFSWAWWCLSWGTDRAPSFASITRVPKDAFACNTIRCYVWKGIDLDFDVLGLFFNNPIQLWTIGIKYLSALVITKLPILWKVVGTIITFLFLNILAFIYLRVAYVIMRACVPGCLSRAR